MQTVVIRRDRFWGWRQGPAMFMAYNLGKPAVAAGAFQVCAFTIPFMLACVAKHELPPFRRAETAPTQRRHAWLFVPSLLVMVLIRSESAENAGSNGEGETATGRHGDRFVNQN